LKVKKKVFNLPKLQLAKSVHSWNCKITSTLDATMTGLTFIS
jgi:hypothetical protein